jgi:uncharacterized membrane protein (UPF0127 family)
MRFTAFLILGFLLIGCNKTEPDVVRGSNEFRKDGTLDFLREDGSLIITIDIEIVADRQSQATGLMGRTSLPARGGMLFTYDAPADQSFWMKNTPLPLDIIFIGADSSVVNIVKRTTPLSTATIESTSPAQYVLEVRGGLTDRLKVDSSTRFRWKTN